MIEQDSISPWSLDHVQDVLEHMRKLESGLYQRPDPHSLPDPFNGLWRQQIVSWMYTLVRFCKLRQEAAAAGSYFLDVAVSKGLVTTPREYQLCAMTCLYLGLKVFDSPTLRVIKLSSLAKLGNGAIAEKDVIQMERDILKALEWRVNPPTPNCFLHQYMLLLPKCLDRTDRIEIEALSGQAIEVCMSRDYLCGMNPSILGYAVLLVSLDHVMATRDYKKTVNSLPDLRGFLDNMNEVAKVDNTDLLLSRATTLLDRTMRNLPISDIQEFTSTKSGKHRPNTKNEITPLFGNKGFHSPNNVAQH